MRALTFLARRFVAGDTVDEAVEAVRALNRDGLKATLDNLGEETKTREEAENACREYVTMLRKIAEAEADCNISLKLTQFGLNLDESLARDNLARVLEEARKLGNFARIDMEGSAYTQKTLDLFYSLFPEPCANVGVVIQSALKRSEQDVAELVRRKARVRLVKGAYKEPPDIAFQKKSEVDESYDRLAAMLVKAPMPAFATHDDGRIAGAVSAAQAAGLAKTDYEIQMLYGIRPRRWRELAQEGHRVRVYVPYGTCWLPYYSRRIRERKENLFFALRGIFSD
ncbi:MAG: proline dehydrogenase family protein [Elusimicrobia bacterium]|nr:proline dehydrogenase family protein [Elusimicrobiota bacterium]MDE2313455.1 proline dehydrogenase family protein [Elusimicrobiota bacterium]